jgi:ABC-type oligopeptide transport system ATPase subunit
VREIAAKCRLNLEHLRRFPHAFSGGQRQRISIARALVSRAEIRGGRRKRRRARRLDPGRHPEPAEKLQRDLGLTFLFISHDLSVVAHTCDHRRGDVSRPAGRDGADARAVSPTAHPYTKALMSAIPSLDPDDRGKAQKLEGEIPSPTNPPPGCKFHTRCPSL